MISILPNRYWLITGMALIITVVSGLLWLSVNHRTTGVVTNESILSTDTTTEASPEQLPGLNRAQRQRLHSTQTPRLLSPTPQEDAAFLQAVAQNKSLQPSQQGQQSLAPDRSLSVTQARVSPPKAQAIIATAPQQRATRQRLAERQQRFAERLQEHPKRQRLHQLRQRLRKTEPSNP